MDKQQKFVEVARGWIGTPWAHQGRSRTGIDCVGLVIEAAKECGLPIDLEPNYGRMQNYARAKALLSQFCERVANPEVGDIVLYKDSQRLHVAIVSELREGKIRRVIHAHSEDLSVVESRIGFAPLNLWRIKWH